MSKLNKNTMKKVVIIVFCFIGIYSATAQEYMNELNSMLENFRLSVFNNVHDLDSPTIMDQYEGSPFLKNQWTVGSINLISGQSYRFPMKYFVLGEQIWLKNPSDSIRSLNFTNQVREVQLDDHRFIYGSYIVNNKVKAGILEVLYQNKSKLYKLYVCTFVKGEKKSTYQEKEKDKFVMKENIYYQMANMENASDLPRSKKDFFNIFGTQKTAVEKYFKENKLKMKEGKDLIKVFNYFDTLN